MEYVKIIQVLHSKTRQEIIRVLDDNIYTCKEIFQKIINNKKINIKNRETIYRSLEMLVNTELVDKFYKKDKGICYKLMHKKIVIDLIDQSISVIN